MISIRSIKGSEIKYFLDDIGSLRIQVFSEWPYLYDGDLDYEKKYLETYIRSSNSFAYLLYDDDTLIGATTAIYFLDESNEFKKPFIENGFDLNSIVYFGESLLLKPYRGRGYGKEFMNKRIEFAKSIPGIDKVTFCSVLRDEDDIRKPVGFKNLETFWKSFGFKPYPDLIAHYIWKDIGDTQESSKPLQFWIKSIK